MSKLECPNCGTPIDLECHFVGMKIGEEPPRIIDVCDTCCSKNEIVRYWNPSGFTYEVE